MRTARYRMSLTEVPRSDVHGALYSEVQCIMGYGQMGTPVGRTIDGRTGTTENITLLVGCKNNLAAGSAFGCTVIVFFFYFVLD